MSTLELTQKIEMLPQEEYAMVETYVNRISELAAKFLGIHTTSQETLDYWNE